MKKEERIETEQDLVSLFIEQSVGLYVKQKSNVHHGWQDQTMKPWSG